MTSLYIDNPSCIELGELMACGSTTLIIDATVTVTITDSSDVEVTGETWPLAMPYDSATSKYRGITAAALGLTEGDQYRVNIVAKNGGGAVLASFNINIRATKRMST